MHDLHAGNSSSADRRRGRLRLLTAVLVVMFAVYLVSGYVSHLDSSSMPPFLSNLLGRTRPLGSWATDEVVRRFLNGQSVYRMTETSANKVTCETLTIREADITSLRLAPGEGDEFFVHFDLEQDGKRYRVDGTCTFVGGTEGHVLEGFTGQFETIP